VTNGDPEWGIAARPVDSRLPRAVRAEVAVADDAVMTCQRLSEHGIAVWLTGGWGIDALLREQTRPHKDLDLLVLVDDVVRLRTLLARDACHLKEL